ncbi:SMI1/KNR4 family protein [Streptomyces sp. SCUT-3]|uniref:SMI1/KNR4 family protein n=1 Tax=Streptomyces sp. SCUT-3 TaxID=2684469 RepID=UPI000CC1E980|nr:SMI1/KNR4 family protein [Streptomyces sp. SCUT-3]PLW72642.1 hypothetical protein C0036_11540 [Streptomyces sp. DJ]QMV21172.1 SMI1/KNR4 family protein [Streptomyces sp. SCUT-3]
MNASVARLTEILPPPATPQPKDWEAVERELGTPLPSDYKQLVDTYGGGVFDETIWLLEPGCPDENYDLLAASKEREEVLGELWGTGEPKPVELQEEGARALPWGYGEGGGEFLYWLVRPGQDPDSWTVMINEGRGPEWERHPMSCTQFLVSVLTGETDSGIFCELPVETHGFDRNADIL